MTENRDPLATVRDQLRTRLHDELEMAAFEQIAIDLDAMALELYAEHGSSIDAVSTSHLRGVVARQIVGPRAWTPCPPWCELAPGHPFVDGDSDDLARYHVGPTISAGPMTVHVTQLEHAAAPAGPIHLEPMGADVWTEPADGRAELATAADLRGAAAALLEAATQLDAIASQR